ncbi:hypothetical protein GOQ27_01240 [Clostridium sp. D2Q-11]|uniref:Uncharacterized protein n=1 Tax=Anaeromonas frigoriresistens TaxID=2683708 RepID=A0A942Z7K9_9FIRM|nr:hypothetical protein [Anaeromonas frigoriresistens]MBS4537065.1 hypothetical protein [Anaeromonas frigoriresistens]
MKYIEFKSLKYNLLSYISRYFRSRVWEESLSAIKGRYSNIADKFNDIDE